MRARRAARASHAPVLGYRRMAPHIRSQALNLAYRVPIEGSSDMGLWGHHHGSWWTRRNELRSILHVSSASLRRAVAEGDQGDGREIAFSSPQ